MGTSANLADTAKRLKALLKEKDNVRIDAARLDELRRLLVQQDRSLGNGPAQIKWNDFLAATQSELIAQLSANIHLSVSFLRTFLGVIAARPLSTTSSSSNKATNNTNDSRHQTVDATLLISLVQALVPHKDLLFQKSYRTVLVNEFLKFHDVQYYLYSAIIAVAKQVDNADTLVDLLLMIPPLPNNNKPLDMFLFPPPNMDNNNNNLNNNSDSDDESEDDDQDDDSDDEQERPVKRQRTDFLCLFQRHTKHYRLATNAWLAVLKAPMSPFELRAALRFLPDFLEHSPRPLQFADFFMKAYQNTGVVPVLALQGLFYLMTQHGLEHVDYYKQLYKLLKPSLFYVKYRSNFCNLVAQSLLYNEMLPAHVVASFCKRLLRIALSAQPGAILWILGLVSNLLRKHPEINCLIQRQQCDDQFNADTDDPEESHALQSSLWELSALEQHYYPAVVTLAKSVGRPEELQAPLHDLSELSPTYPSLFEQERSRRHKNRKTPLTFVEPQSLFVPDDVFAGILKTA